MERRRAAKRRGAYNNGDDLYTDEETKGNRRGGRGQDSNILNLEESEDK